MSSYGFRLDEQTTSQNFNRINASYLVMRVTLSISILVCLKYTTRRNLVLAITYVTLTLAKLKVS